MRTGEYNIFKAMPIILLIFILFYENLWQVDAGLRFESNKQKYQHMFTIRTPKRTYYLAAESEEDMNKWVDCVCHVCGLKPFMSEDTVTGSLICIFFYS